MKYSNEMINNLVAQNQYLLKKMDDQFENGVAIYGAGVVGTWAVDYLRSIGAKVKCFIDRDIQKHNSKISDVKIISPMEIDNSIKSIFIASRHAVSEVKESLGENNYSMISFDGYFVLKNYTRLKNIRDNFLEDTKSIEVFNAILHSMLTSSLQSCYDVMEKDMYFSLPEFSGNFDENFVDVGAFVGDSVERFIWENLGTFKHIYAFEPGKRQFEAMETRVDRLSKEWAFNRDKVSLINAGLSSSESEMSCTFVDDYPIRHGLVATQDENSNKSDDMAKVLTLDSYFSDKTVSFLKIDIEGMEMEFLRGGTEVIKRDRPKIAICVYHYPSDLYEIAEFIRDLVPKYKFKIRQHAPIFGDFVLYCYE